MSAGLHVGMIAIAVAGLPALLDPDPPLDALIVVEMVTLEESGIDKPKLEPMEPAEDPPVAQPKPPPPTPATRPVPPPPAPQPPRAKEPQVAALPPEPAPEPEVVPAPEPETVQPVLEPPPPKPIVLKPPPDKPKLEKPPPIARKVAAPRRKPPPPPDAFETLLRNLDKRRQDAVGAQAKVEQERATMPRLKRPDLPDRRQESSLKRRQIIAALVQHIRTQIRPCWNPPIGAKDAHRIRVGVRILLNPDGTLIGRPYIVDQDRMFRDPAFQAFAESAIRALQNPRCSPLRLPLATYDTWREISFNFDTTELLQ